MNDSLASRLRAFGPGLILVFLAFILGFGLGALFGACEDSMKGKLRADAAAVLVEKYGGDQAKADKVIEKSWVYLQRSHLHAGVLAGCSLAMILFLALLAPPGRAAKLFAFLLGFGAFAYGLFWLGAGFLAPGLGSTGAAKESLRWLGWAGSVSLIFGLLATGGLGIKALCSKAKD